jgi:transposase
MTQYKRIVGFENYRIGDDGTVWVWLKGSKANKKNPPRWRKLKPRRWKGSMRIALINPINGRQSCLMIARLVLSHFVGPRPLGCVAMRFPDPDPHNNRADNLRWVPQGTARIGCDCSPKGDLNRASKLREKDIARIRSMVVDKGFSFSEVAERYDVSRSTIQSAVKGSSWRESGGPTGEGVSFSSGSRHPRAKLEESDIPQIRDMIIHGHSLRSIGRKYGVCFTTIRNIREGTAWRHVA